MSTVTPVAPEHAHATTVIETPQGPRFGQCRCGLTWEIFPGADESCPVAGVEDDYARSEWEARAYLDRRIYALRQISMRDAALLRGFMEEVTNG